MPKMSMWKVRNNFSKHAPGVRLYTGMNVDGRCKKKKETKIIWNVMQQKNGKSKMDG